MKYFLSIVALLALAFAILAMLGSQSAIHEIEALLACLISTTGFVGAGVIEAIEGRAKR